jgi:predicted SnoaL-like aldol condensation-catalyzing enzyme
MTCKRKEQIRTLLKGIETGEEESVAAINQDKYVQHNPQTKEGGKGLAELFKQLAKSSPRVNIVRIFSDGDYVFAHTEYDFKNSNIGFEIFRFEGDYAIEHWDNIQLKMGLNPSSHTMVDGSSKVTDLKETENNRRVIEAFVDDVLIHNQLDNLEHYINKSFYTEHNPHFSDDLSELHSSLSNSSSNEGITITYDKCHRILAEGNFVLSVCEGSYNNNHSSFFDLYRLESGSIVEHWDTTEVIPPLSEWKNNNGKF